MEPCGVAVFAAAVAVSVVVVSLLVYLRFKLKNSN